MTIRLYAKKNFEGDSMLIDQDYETLVGTHVGNNPSSVRMTEKSDVALLCRLPKWNGGVHYLRGKHSVEDLGIVADGGEAGFRNSVSSVRIKPFTIRINATIVTGANGELPGDWQDRDDVEGALKKIVRATNDFFEDELALLKVTLSDITYREDEERFHMTKAEAGASIPASWRKARYVDVIFVNRIEAAVGVGKFPWQGNFCVVSASRDSIAEMARTFVHELGHYWGLEHRNEQAWNIMAQSKYGKPLIDSQLTPGQIESIHQKLASDLTRQGDRIE